MSLVVPFTFSNRVEGLCGVFDDIPFFDFRTPYQPNNGSMGITLWEEAVLRVVALSSLKNLNNGDRNVCTQILHHLLP
jgi:hypothetical protein